jgi:hypothetical protein
LIFYVNFNHLLTDGVYFCMCANVFVPPWIFLTTRSYRYFKGIRQPTGFIVNF